MTRPLRITGKETIAVLYRAGFELTRVRGSHHFMRHPDGRTTVVPMHSGEIIGPGLMAKILNDCKMTRDEFRSLL